MKLARKMKVTAPTIARHLSGQTSDKLAIKTVKALAKEIEAAQGERS
ncbi:hypothetical protein HC928_16240 [bacterium]|nr:hypothetical protein [bacterium]